MALIRYQLGFIFGAVIDLESDVEVSLWGFKEKGMKKENFYLTRAQETLQRARGIDSLYSPKRKKKSCEEFTTHSC